MPLKSCVPILVILFLYSCGDLKQSQDIRVKAPEEISDSFAIRRASLGMATGSSKRASNEIAIKISSLDKEFLLQGSLIFKPMVRRFENLKSRIVSFRLIDDSLYMLESTAGHTIDLKATYDIILAKFPVKEVTAEFIYFDFAEGMSKVFVTPDWKAQDFEGSSYPTDQWVAVPIETSFVESAKIDHHNNLVIHQKAQARDSAPNDRTPIEVKYYITPYRDNPNFTPKEQKLRDFEKMGFFEVTPRLKPGGGTVVFATKFDHTKPIVYAISANTPEEYRDAIRSGVLYWNKAFGKEVLKVVEAPSHVEAPSFDYNVIQWVDWKDAGFAYADAQMDPRTGEILHSQIFLTSVFAFSGKEHAEKLLKRLLSQKNHEGHFHSQEGSLEKHKSFIENKILKGNNKNEVRLGLKGFIKEPMCDFHPSKNLLEGLLKLFESDSKYDESDYLRISQDYVRETVAHEVGHTLGLRHNFAGSLYSNVDLMEIDQVFLNYVDAKKAPEGLRTTSSVMEYQNFQESSISGDQLVSREEPFDYDNLAIKALYLDKTYKKSELPPFCTDSHRGEYLDCRTFDGGSSLYKNALKQEEYYKKILPSLILENYIEAKNKILKGEAESLSEGAFNPTNYVFNALSERWYVLTSFTKGSNSQFLAVNREFSSEDPFAEEARNRAKKAYIEKQLVEVGGLDKLFQKMTQEELLEIMMKFANLIQEYQFKAILTSEDKMFSDNELSIIKEQSQKFFTSYYSASIIADLTYFFFAKNLMDASFSNDLTKMITQRVRDVILTTSETEETVEHGGKILHIPEFAYPAEVRKAVSDLLKDGSDDFYWGMKEKDDIKDEFKALLEKSVGKDVLDTTNPLKLPEKLARWVIENKKVLGTL